MRAQVEAWAAVGLPHDDTAKMLSWPTGKAIDPKTLRKHFRYELDTAAIKANANVAANMYKRTTGSGRDAVNAGKFWLTHRAGWKAAESIEISGPGGAPIQQENSTLSPEEKARRVAALIAEHAHAMLHERDRGRRRQRNLRADAVHDACGNPRARSLYRSRPEQGFSAAGPQTTSYHTTADWILYGGSAGGGKTFLAILKALTKHRRSLILRREFPQLGSIIETAAEIYAPYGERSGRFWNCVYEGKTRSIEYGACQYEANKSKYQGRPKDLYVFDEAANFTVTMVTFTTAWNRHEDPTQHAQVLLCSNPPTDSTGDWLMVWFAPWLEPSHPNPAKPGELR